MSCSPVRIVPLEPPYDERTRRLLSLMAPAGSTPTIPRLFTTLLHNIQLAESMQPLGRLLLRMAGSGSLTRRDREIVILRVSVNCRAEYEWGVHAATLSAGAGLTPAQIADSQQQQVGSALWSSRDRLLLRLCDQLHRESTVNAELWTQLEGAFDVPEILELLSLVGWYHMVAYITNVAGTELESWAARFSTAARELPGREPDPVPD